MNKKQLDDLNYGSKFENELFEILKEKYNDVKFCKSNFEFDYIADNCYIELKSRRNTKNKYPTTMIGLNKIKLAKKLFNEGHKIYFYFHFTDGFYFYKYSPDDNFDVCNGGRCDRGKYEYKKYVYIPVCYLQNI